MTKGDPDNPTPTDESPLKDLDRRVTEAQARQRRAEGREPGAGPRNEAIGVGLRIAIELAAAVVVGAFLGIVLDNWLGTRPWMLILFFILGTAAGFLNVYRTAKDIDRKVKERRAAGAKREPPGGGNGT